MSRKYSPRKAADEWRAINRVGKVRVRPKLILAVPDQRNPGQYITGEGYWHDATQAWWWWANIPPDPNRFDSITELHGAGPAFWMPFPEPPSMPVQTPRKSTAKRASRGASKIAEQPLKQAA